MRPVAITETDLSLVSLGGADPRETNLAGLWMREANLAAADPRGADMRGADLSGARLSGARLARADLRGTRVGAASLVPADVTGTRVDMALAVGYARAHGLMVDLAAEADSAKMER